MELQTKSEKISIYRAKNGFILIDERGLLHSYNDPNELLKIFRRWIDNVPQYPLKDGD
jgi:hypothetical protein